MKLESVTLEGRHIRLEPLELAHLDDLCKYGLAPELWIWNAFPKTNKAEMKKFLESQLAMREAGTAHPFVTRELATNEIVGSTSFGNIDLFNKKLEIGWTWVAPHRQRTFVNTEAKFLMFRHAFEVFGCRRVELKTDALNQKSRNAILRIGAKEEGIFRNHMITATERMRDSVYFSVIDKEWPEVKEKLLERMNKHQGVSK